MVVDHPGTAPRSPAERRYGDRTIVRSRADPDSPNVVFISLDDTNDWPGFLANHPGTSTPHMDALAARGTSFTRAYCTAPACLPARTSVMFGVRPIDCGVVDHRRTSGDRYVELASRTPSLVDAYWAAGYVVLGAGKVFHTGNTGRWSDYHRTKFYVDVRDRSLDPRQLQRFDPEWISPYDGKPIGTGEHWPPGGVDFGPSGRPPSEDPDGVTTSWVVDQLGRTRRRPLFLGVGLTSTHTPWRVPREFFDLHPLDEIVLPDIRPEDLDVIGPYAREKIHDRLLAFERLHDRGAWPRAVQAYQAAMSYADAQVGRILDALATSPIADNTIICLWSDHGFHIGEKMHFHKFTLWERATRVPLLLFDPRQPTAVSTFDEPVSTLDIGPTLAEMCNIGLCTEQAGASLLPLLEDPSLAAQRPAISTWMGENHAVRRGPWRFIRYENGECELYDYRSDPDERVNLAGRPELAEIERELATLLPPAAVADTPPA